MIRRASVHSYIVEHMRRCRCSRVSHEYAFDKVVMQDARTLPIIAEIGDVSCRLEVMLDHHRLTTLRHQLVFTRYDGLY
jgi:hypothetical protein